MEADAVTLQAQLIGPAWVWRLDEESIMVFDEVWRRDLARNGSPMLSGDTLERVELFTSRSPKASATDDLDERKKACGRTR
jgi:hypothetical protein